MSNNTLSAKILLVGGAGYIGSQTNLALLEAGFETVVFDNLSGSKTPFVPEQSIFFRGNILDKADLRQVFNEHDFAAVVHLAASLQVGESVLDPAKYYTNNVVGTLNLLEMMREHKVNNLIFSSTAAVFGLPNVIPVTETAPKVPINPYGHSKLMIEQVLQDYHQAYNFGSVTLRYFNACGADRLGRTGANAFHETHLISLLLRAIKNHSEFSIFGDDYNTIDGTCVRDYVHVEDLAKAHVSALQLALKSKEPICESFNLGTKNGYSVRQIIDTVERVTGSKVNLKVGPRRPGDPDILIADNSKAKVALGWGPVNSTLDNIIETAWQWEQKL